VNPHANGFHPGELAVQQRAGLLAQAARLEGMLAPALLGRSAAMFLANQRLAVLTARDDTGRLWTSPLVGTPGFLEASAEILTINTTIARTDPLCAITPGSDIGIVIVDFAAGRRLRINGRLTGSEPGRLNVTVQQAYGNCPSYIQKRALDMPLARFDCALPVHIHAIDRDHAALITRADTFFLGTVHPSRGADTSHKGGRPGFVRLDGQQLWWPDYPGNNLFNSMGNIAENPEAALLFLDFDAGTVLQLSGSAQLEWTDAGVSGDDADTGRRIRFTPNHIVTGTAPLHARGVTVSRANPYLRP
jgi:uncharacterized protein